MNPRNTWLLVALAAGLFAFIFFFERRWHPPAPPSRVVLPGFKAAAVTSVQIQTASQADVIRAELTNGVWRLTQPVASAARPAAIEDLLKAMEQLTYDVHMTAQDLHDRPKAGEEFGLEPPRLTISFEQAGSERQLKFGNQTPPGDQIYAQLVGMGTVDVVGTDIFKYIPRHANDWRDTIFADWKAVSFDRLIVTNGEKILELQRDATNGAWRMTRPMDARADGPKIESLLHGLRELRVTRFETDDPKADSEVFGLRPPRWQLGLYQGTNLAMSFQFGKSPTNDDSKIFARLSGQSSIMRVPADQLEAWCADYEKFRDPRLASLDSGQLDVIEVLGQENFRLERFTNDLWAIDRKLPVDVTLMRDFIENLARLQVVPVNGQFAKDAVGDRDPALADYGLATPARKYVLKRLSSVAGVISTNLSVVAELQFGAEKEGKVFARRPEETSVYAVKAEDFHKLPATTFDLVARSIWNFPEDAVRQVTLRVNGAIQKIQHIGTNNWIPGTQGIINPAEIEEGVHELGLLRAGKWVASGVSNLAQYGFTDHSTRISLDFFDEKAPTVTVEISNPSPGKPRYGAVKTQEGQIWVFEFAPEQFDRIRAYLGIREGAAH